MLESLGRRGVVGVMGYVGVRVGNERESGAAREVPRGGDVVRTCGKELYGCLSFDSW